MGRIEQPTYIPGTDAWQKRMQEAQVNQEEAQVVHCFPVPKGKYSIVNDRVHYPDDETGAEVVKTVKRQYDLCPICGKYLHVWFVGEPNYIACCCEGHTKECLAYVSQQYEATQRRKAGTYRIVGGVP